MRTLTVDEVDAVSGAHPIAFWAVAAYLAPKVVAGAKFTAGFVAGTGLIYGGYLVSE